jgi:hypothetical protein
MVHGGGQTWEGRTMKEYKRYILENLEISEQTEALSRMQPSMTVVLNYMITSLERGIKRGTASGKDSPETIKKWRTALDLVKTIQAMY